MNEKVIDMVMLMPAELEEIKRESAREALKKARKRKITAIKNFIGLTAVLVLPPLGMCLHWIVVGY